MSDLKRQPPARIRFTVRGRFKSFVYACRGLRWLVQEEHNARLHLAASGAVIVVGFALNISLEDWRWLVLAMTLVWVTEALNTAIEDLCDHVCADFEPSIGRVKDLAAGAVLVASIAAAMIGALTLGPPLIARIF